MKIPFDIKYRPQIESGEYKVVTRDGSPVRIICWDRKSAGDGQPIVALVENGHYENSIWVEENGIYKGTMGHDYDLFVITPGPELAESEDERTRKALIETIDSIENFPNKSTAIAYLEKQKEMPTDEEMKLLLRTEYEKGVADTIAKYEQKEQKPVETSDFKTKLAEYLQNNSPKDGQYVISSETILEMAKEELLKRGELQKPAEWNPNNEDVILFNKAVTTNPNLTPSERAKLDIIRTKFKHCNEIPQEQKPVECIPDSIKFDEGFKTGREVGFREGVESVKPAEWSEEEKEKIRQNGRLDVCYNPEKYGLCHKIEWNEEDESNLDYLIDFCNSQENGKHPILTTLVARKLSNWLYRLKSGELHIKTAPNLEWTDSDENGFESVCNVLRLKLDESNSKPLIDMLLRMKASYCYRENNSVGLNEDDEKTIHLACEFIRHRAESNGSIGGVDYAELIKRLKSLPLNPKKKNEDVAKLCSNEWSEEDENKIESIKGLITMGRFADANTIWTVWNLLDSLRPSWKPSEEQMEALSEAVSTFDGYEESDAIKSLYNDLKKLKGGVAPMRDIDE